MPHPKALVAVFVAAGLIEKLIDGVATSGVVAGSGAENLPYIWLVDLALALSAGTAWAAVVDRHPRKKVVARLFMCAAAVLVLAGAILATGVAQLAVFAMLYVASAQLLVVAPSALWTLAGDATAPSAVRTTFGHLSAADAVGQLTGYAVTAWLGVTFVQSMALDVGSLAAAVLLCALAILLVRAVQLQPTPVAPNPMARKEFGFRSGVAILRNCPHLRRIALLVALNWVAITAVVYWVMVALASATTGDASRFRLVYSFYNIGSMLLILLAQALFARRAAKLSPTRSLLVLPLAIAVGCCSALVLDFTTAAIAAALAMYMAQYAWDTPARQTLLAAEPVETRGRTLALLDSYAYTAGSASGAALLAVMNQVLPAAWVHKGPLALAAAAACAAFAVARGASEAPVTGSAEP